MRLSARQRFARFVLICIVATGIFLLKTAFDWNRGAKQLQAARLNRIEMAEQVEALRERLRYMQTDEYIMRVARQELGYILPGEIRYVVEE
ncbi:MAG: septum formation initiator family protein [Clostridia bacterium]|nr:septum formation initiator family protein [Clostridia bacterium]